MIPSKKKGKGVREDRQEDRNVVSQVSLTPDILPVVNTLELKEICFCLSLTVFLQFLAW